MRLNCVFHWKYVDSGCCSCVYHPTVHRGVAHTHMRCLYGFAPHHTTLQPHALPTPFPRPSQALPKPFRRTSEHCGDRRGLAWPGKTPTRKKTQARTDRPCRPRTQKTHNNPAEALRHCRNFETHGMTGNTSPRLANKRNTSKDRSTLQNQNPGKHTTRKPRHCAIAETSNH